MKEENSICGVIPETGETYKLVLDLGDDMPEDIRQLAINHAIAHINNPAVREWAKAQEANPPLSN